MPKEIKKNSKGQFVKGTASGNPKGRPKGSKNRISEMKRELEVAIRESLDPETIKGVVQSMVAEALNGNVSAGKLILDKVVSNARADQDEAEERPEIVIKIENLTPPKPEEVIGEIIDQEPEYAETIRNEKTSQENIYENHI
jgi:hypothetical protein